jgi:hypothetical protein
MPIALLVIGAIYLQGRRRRQKERSLQTTHPLSNSSLEIGSFEPLQESLTPRRDIASTIVGFRR